MAAEAPSADTYRWERAAFLVAALLAAGCARPAQGPVAPSPAVDAQGRLASEALAAGDYPRAAEQYRAALDKTPEETRFADFREGLLTGLGTVAADPEEGVRSYRAALELAERRGASPGERAGLMMGLGARTRHAGRCAEARGLLEEAVALAGAMSRDLRSGLLLNLGNAHRECGDLGRSRALYEEALGLSDAHWKTARIHYGLAALDLLDGAPEPALAAIDRALHETELGAVSEQSQAVRVFDLRACILRAAGLPQEAGASVARADAIVRDHPAAFSRAELRGLEPRLAAVCSAGDS